MVSLDQNINRDNASSKIKMIKACLSRRQKATPDWLQNHLIFTKSALFIWGLVLSHSIVEYATVCILMLYLTSVIGNSLMLSAIVINVLDGLSDAFSFLNAYVADAYTGRFSVIVFSAGAYTMGLLLLWITAWSSVENSMFYVAVVLLAIGKSGRGTTFQSFFEYQLRERKEHAEETNAEDQNTENIREEPQKDVPTMTWWHSAWFCGYVIAIWALGNATWLKALKVSALVMGGTCLLFYSGFFYYFNEEPTRGSLGSILRHFKTAKYKEIFLWATFFAYSLVLATGNTLFIAQTSNMNLHVGQTFLVPYSSFFVLKSFISDMVVFLFWLGKATQKGITLVRIGFGMICAAFCCVVARQIELHRLSLISKEGVLENPSKAISLSVLWLIPQYSLLGLMEGLAGGGLVTYTKNYLPQSMISFAEPFIGLVLCFGKFGSILFMINLRSQFGQDINNSHLDRYFLVLAVLSSLFLCLFLCWSILSCANSETHLGCEESETEVVELHKPEGEMQYDEEAEVDTEENCELGKIVLRLRSKNLEGGPKVKSESEC